jgi:fatty acid desaturase
MPEGPDPITATFFPVFSAGGSGLTQPCSHALSTIAHSMVLMVTGLSSMFSVHDASHGAGQIRPVNSGKLFVECRLRDASSHLLL